MLHDICIVYLAKILASDNDGNCEGALTKYMWDNSLASSRSMGNVEKNLEF